MSSVQQIQYTKQKTASTAATALKIKKNTMPMASPSALTMQPPYSKRGVCE